MKEPAVAYNKRLYTVEEYLDLEHEAVEKSEYYQGEIFAMSGAKNQHNIVCMNVLANISLKLRGKPCRPYNSDMRVHIPQNTLFTYPDISVVCGEPEFYKNDEYNLLNPSVIIEVLSPSTRKYDMGRKFELYKAIPTLQEYILIDPGQVNILSYCRNGMEWERKEYSDITTVLIINVIKLRLKLTAVYEGTSVAML
ncbi:MAG: Uma2 family endonuclease [Taibaiella sp.]|nr:Uma2 family endonuclease [Taibaiella sp.]